MDIEAPMRKRCWRDSTVWSLKSSKAKVDVLAEGNAMVAGINAICPAIEVVQIGVESLGGDRGIEMACEYGPMFAGAQ